MAINIDPKMEARLRQRAEADGLSITAYLERLIAAEESGLEELESLALEGLHSGAPIDVGTAYWQEKHRALDDSLKSFGSR